MHTCFILLASAICASPDTTIVFAWAHDSTNTPLVNASILAVSPTSDFKKSDPVGHWESSGGRHDLYGVSRFHEIWLYVSIDKLRYIEQVRKIDGQRWPPLQATIPLQKPAKITLYLPSRAGYTYDLAWIDVTGGRNEQELRLKPFYNQTPIIPTYPSATDGYWVVQRATVDYFYPNPCAPVLPCCCEYR